jgi:RHS repeat-associated protein
MDDKQRIALVETRTLDTAGDDEAPRQVIRYQFSNHLGSASLELDDQAQISSYEEYSPYGSTTYQAVRSRMETAKRYRYTGKERDEESGLYYHGARYYSPWLGRWTSCDQARILAGHNRYMYVQCNPVHFSDPSGEAGEASQMELIQQTELRQPVTPTVTSRGYGQDLRTTYQALNNQWMAWENTDVGDPEDMPFARTPAGNTRSLFAQSREENQRLGRTLVKAEVAAARAAGQFVREKGVDPTGIKGTVYGQPPLMPKLQNVRVNDPVSSPPAVTAPSATLTPAGSKATSEVTQLELALSSPAPTAKSGTAPSAATAPSPPAAPVKAAASTPATSQTPQISNTPKNTGGTTLTPKMNAAGGAGSALIKGVVPGAAEAEVGLLGAAYYAAQSPLTARLAPLLVTASEAVPIAGAGFVAGVAAGSQYENAAASLGAGETVITGTGLAGAVLSGAAVGALIGAPTAIGAPIGAVIGGAAAAIGYGVSKWLL